MATIGVKIELEGAPQYKENMANLNQQTKLYQAQLKALTAEMGSNTSAFKKSITESKALEQQLEAQKNQSKLLEEQIAKTSEKYGEDSTQVLRLKTQYQNLQAAIATTTKELESHGGTLGAISAQFSEIGDKLQGVGDKVSSVGDKLTKGLTAPIAAIGAASTVAFNEVDAGLDTIIKKTGANGEALEELQEIYENIATTIPASFDEVGNAVGEVNTRFGATGEELENLSTKFIEFAQLNDTSVSNSIDTVQGAMAAFNLSSEDTSEVLDILNKAGQDTGISVDSLASSLLTNASAMTEMGFSFNESAGFIANLEKNGIDASAAMAGLKKAFTNASKDGKGMDEALAELQETMNSASSDTEAYQAAIELFGSKAGPALAKAVQEGRISFDEAKNSIQDYADSVTSTFEATLDPMDQFQVNMNQLKLVGTDLVNSAAPMITEAMTIMGDVIQKVADAWNSLSEDEKENVIQIGLVVAAIGPAVSMIGKLISGIGSVASGIGSVIKFLPTLSGLATTIGGVITGTVIPAIGGVITALTPFLPIIAAVAAAIAAVILVVQNWGTITDWVSEKWAMFTEFISNAVLTIQNFFEEHFGILGQIFSTKLEIIKIIVQTAFNAIKIIIETIGKLIKAIFSGDWDAIGEIFSEAWEKLKETVGEGIKKVFEKIGELGEKIKDKFDELKQDAIDWGKHLIQNFIDGIMAKWEALKQKVQQVAQTVKDFLGFTEPEMGPLKNFNSWPRHMMENYANGIDAARYLVQDAIADIAQDVTVLANPIDSEEVYAAIQAGASDANLSLAIGDREFKRSMRDMGVSFG